MISNLLFVQSHEASSSILPIVATIIGIVAGLLTILRFFYLVPKKKKKTPFRENNPFRKYFRIIVKVEQIDCMVFPMGLRKEFPLIDVLYLEYIKYNLIHSTYKQVIIYPIVDLSASSQDAEDYKCFQENINKLFAGYCSRVSVIAPFNYVFDINDPNLLSAIKYTGSSEYFNLMKKEFSLNVRSIKDFSKHHPPSMQLLAIITHIFKTWQIVSALREQDKDSYKKYAILIWETEFEKLGMFLDLFKNDLNKEVEVVLGKTIKCKKAKPPVFDVSMALCIFSSKSDIVERILKTEHCFQEIYIDIIKMILQSNYGCTAIDNEDLISIGKGLVHNKVINSKEIADRIVDRRKLILIGLVLKLRESYELF